MSNAAAARPLRSLLFVPGNRSDRFDRALAAGADAVIFDLEASVPSAELPSARRLVRDAIRSLPSAKTPTTPAIFVRIADTDSQTTALDLEAACAAPLDGIVIPNVRGPEHVRCIDELLSIAEEQAGVEVGSTAVVPTLETARSIYHAYEVGTSSPRVSCVIGGTSDQGDVARAIGYQWTADGLETLYIRSKVLLDSRAAGIEYPITGVWGDVRDLDGFRKFCLQNRQLGYRGMVVIHPSHVPVANDVFSPTQDEIAAWREVINEMSQLEADGRGASTLDGRLIDAANVKTAQAGLAWAAAVSGARRAGAGGTAGSQYQIEGVSGP